jgi:subtilisin-like proprotein convertase family protein
VTSNLTVNLAITNATYPAGIGAQPSAVLTIINDDSAVSFSAANYSVSKNILTGFAPIDVIRLGTTNGTCSVDFVTTTNGSAAPGVDFYPTNTTITFNPGDTDKQIQVPIINNSLPEGYRTVTFALNNAVNTALVSPSNATLTIIDTVYAPGQLSFSTTNYTAYESDGNAYLTVVRTNGTSGTVTVAYNTVAGTALPGLNYVTTSGTLSFNNGDASKTFAVPLVNNNIAQGPVSLSVVLSNPSSGAVLIAPTNATLTLLHTNIGVAFVNATNYVRETNGLVPIFVQRFGGASSSAQVNYATANGTAVAGVNYTAVSGSLTFNAGETLKTISLPLLYDPQVTGNLELTMSLSSPSAGVQLASPSNTVVVLQDADAGLSFLNPASSVYKNAGSAVITVVCSNPGVEPLSVHYSTTNGTAVAGVDYTATSGTLVFTGGVGTNTFSVPILTNSLVNGNHTFTVSLSNPTPPGQLVSPSNQVVTIIDSNSGLSFSSPTYTVLKTGVAATITVLRIENTNTVSSVNFATANGTAVAGLDYIATNGTCVFTNGETSKTFSVTVINNTVVQPDKTVLVQLSNPVNGILIAPYAATLTIHDTSGSFVVPAGSMLISETNAGPPNGIIDPGETVALLFAFRDAGGNDVTNLYATLLNINGVTNASTPKYYGRLTVGGPSVSQSFSFKAVGTNGQQIVVTFKLEDVVGGVTNNIGTNSFTYTLGTSINTFANTNLIIINDHAIASPYPSTINVSGVGGLLIKATVTFVNLTHSWPADIDALLESPSQQSALLMAHAGGGYAVNGVTLTFDDATNYPFLTNAAQIVSGTYRPTAFILSPAFSPPAPAAPYATNLSGLYAGNPNGVWSLFVIDDAAINAGAISNGWSLTLITSSPIALQPPQFGSFVNSNGTFRLTITSPSYSTIIEASTNLVNWVPVYTNMPPFTFTNSNASSYPYRFYRAVLGP